MPRKITLAEVRSFYHAGGRPEELIRDLLARIAEWDDPALFIHLPAADELLDMARDVARLPRDLPLWGVPFVVKDNIDVAGWPTTAGCPGFARVAQDDAGVVRLLREAGAIPLGKANLDQFATGLVGTRSPYGVPRNAVAAGYLPGGSSSGSASALAAGLCAFSLGTDTAGSGRVPAAFQELTGWKPTCGLLSLRGVVPACRSLDCVSVFANAAVDAAEIAAVVARYDGADPFSRQVGMRSLPTRPRVGVPRDLDFSGDPDTPGLFAAAVRRAVSLGLAPVEVDLTPFTEAARLLYEGPWVAERWVAVGDFVESHGESVFPVTRSILEASKDWHATDVFRAQYRLRELAREAERVWKEVDVLLLPTTPRLYRVDENLADPVATNSVLGRYTNFMNLLDLAAVAVPAGRARGGVAPWGVTLAAPAGHDRALLELAARWNGEEGVPVSVGQRSHRIPLVVCGAHLEGLALHWQLAERGARLLARTRTASAYRLYAMPGGGGLPPRPALVHDAVDGAAIAVEVWELEAAAFGDFVARIPAPLGVGKVLLADGSEVPGFIAEPRALADAVDITSFGGWRAWLGQASGKEAAGN